AFWTDNSEGQVNITTIPYIRIMIEKGKNVQLQLRRLEDMKEEEAIELVRLVVHEDEYINVTTYLHNFTNGLMVGWGLVKGRINEVTDYFNATGERSWSGDQFNYLLQKHFDLFGLINAGLAVDSKTINQ
ncbi:MAG TPA: hypothetical protein VEV15_11940, partial [Flavisolibacter sp.]|nr:hypothetical protein [Flavisolibacter sp.]